LTKRKKKRPTTKSKNRKYRREGEKEKAAFSLLPCR
jgi:hypothetical protein